MHNTTSNKMGSGSIFLRCIARSVQCAWGLKSQFNSSFPPQKKKKNWIPWKGAWDSDQPQQLMTPEMSKIVQPKNLFTNMWKQLQKIAKEMEEKLLEKSRTSLIMKIHTVCKIQKVTTKCETLCVQEYLAALEFPAGNEFFFFQYCFSPPKNFFLTFTAFYAFLDVSCHPVWVKQGVTQCCQAF